MSDAVVRNMQSERWRLAKLSLPEPYHASFLALFFGYWRRPDRFLPDDDDALAAVCGVTLERWRAMRPLFLEHFRVTDGMWRPRLL